MKSKIVGVDIGGSHITAALVDMHTKTVIRPSRIREHVDAKDEAGNIIQKWASVIKSVAKFGHINTADLYVGMAMPGPFDYENGISWITGLDKYETLYRLNVKELLSDVLDIPTDHILMNNDAACFLQGEMFAGAGRGSSHSIGVTLGTGAGSAIHRNGITVDANLGPSPFKESIADNYLTTRWFVKQYQQRTGHTVADVLELVSYYKDNAVKDIFREYAMHLADFITNFIKQENPKVIVLGGNIARSSHLFLPDVTKILAERKLSIPILSAVLGEDASMLGAASMFVNASTIKQTEY